MALGIEVGAFRVPSSGGSVAADVASPSPSSSKGFV
jgi:hypothetical protein